MSGLRVGNVNSKPYYDAYQNDSAISEKQFALPWTIRVYMLGHSLVQDCLVLEGLGIWW